MKYRCFSSLPFSLCETLSDALGIIRSRTLPPPPPLSEFCIRVLLIISKGTQPHLVQEKRQIFWLYQVSQLLSTQFTTSDISQKAYRILSSHKISGKTRDLGLDAAHALCYLKERSTQSQMIRVHLVWWGDPNLHSCRFWVLGQRQCSVEISHS